MTLAVYPGTFDPMTLGHLDIVTRACSLFDHVIVGVAHNPDKAGRHLFDTDTRAALAREAVHGIGSVEVDIVSGLLVDYCRVRGATVLIKGLRSVTDLDAEAPMAQLNRQLGGPETVFLIASPAYAHTSSSLVKDIARHGGAVADLVPPGVDAALHRALGARGT